MTDTQEIPQKKSPRPEAWDKVIGNARAVEILREAVDGTKEGEATPHILLFGPPGTGKTTMANLIAQATGGALFSTTASTLETSEDVVRFLWSMNVEREQRGRASVLFVDEIHVIGQSKTRLSVDQESLFPLLEDWFFPHNLYGKKFRALDGAEKRLISTTFRVHPFTMIGATTEPGTLNQAVLRRFLVHVELDPYTEEEIAQIAMGAAARMGWEIEPAAAEKISRISRRNPGRAYQFLTQARQRANATKREVISGDVAQEIIDRAGFYPLGLTETDVRVLQLLADRPKGVGQAEICRALSLSASQFSGMIEPYLRSLGFMETLSRRMIRIPGLRYLAQINKVDNSRPEVRAAMQGAA